MIKRRFGRFYLPGRLVFESNPCVTRVMGACSILRAEHMLYSDMVEYTAISYRFREIEQGEIVPEYVWNFSADGDMSCEEVGK